MVSSEKLIKQGIKYTDLLFKVIANRLSVAVLTSDTLESFLEKTNEYTTSNPLVVSGYSETMLQLILSETNNYKFSRPAQKELVRVTIENYVAELISDVGENIKESVREIVRDGYDKKLPQNEIADMISKEINTIKNSRARTIARTEIARTATVSDYIINKERGATGFTVMCRNTCCDKCALTYHGVKNEVPDQSSREFTKGTNIRFDINDTSMLPPLHPNCRCVAVYY